jgi:hypothetical protein
MARRLADRANRREIKFIGDLLVTFGKQRAGPLWPSPLIELAPRD